MMFRVHPVFRLYGKAGPLVALALVLAPGLLAAEDVRVEVARQEPPYYVGEPAVIQFTVEGFDEQPQPTCEMVPEKTVKALRGQMAGASPSVFSQIIQRNGQLYQAKSITYRIDYLVTADQPGDYTIGPFVIRQRKKEARVQALSMAFQAVPDDPDMRIRLILPDKPVYPDQRVPVRIEWWYAGDFEDILKLRIHSPLFDQFRFAPDPQPARGSSRLPIETKEGSLALAAEAREEESDGRRFTVVSATRTLIAERAGEFPLAPITATVRKATGWARSRSPFGDPGDSGFGGSLFGDLMGDRRRPASTALVRAGGEPQKLVVRPFPLEGRPESFAGAVGKGFSIDVAADRTVVRVGDPIGLTITLRGAGNIDNASLPPLSADGGMSPQRFRLPADDIAGTTTVDGEQEKLGVPEKQSIVRGKQFRVSVRVCDESVSEIPPLAYSWFDPESGTYQTTRSKPIALRVMPAKVVSADDVVASPAPGTAGSPVSPKNRASSSGKSESTSVAMAPSAPPVFSLSGADLAIEPSAAVVLRNSTGRFRGVVLPAVVYGAGLLLLTAAVIDRRRRNVDPVLTARRKKVRQQQTKIAHASKLATAQAAEEIAAAVRALLAELPDVDRDEAEAVIAACESVAYAPENSADRGLDPALVQRAQALAARFQEAT
ncbi:MAG: BatD family protein [Pirellulales bacterium]|nr:BatD family protein [Pirellulales bacterium]